MEAAARQAIARDVLGDLAVGNHPHALHFWLELPDPWRGESFARATLQRGVAVAPAEIFAVGRGAVAHAVRLGLGAARDRAELVRALGIVRDTLADTGATGPSIV